MIELTLNNFSIVIKLMHLSKRKAMKNFANILSIERLNGFSVCFSRDVYNINSSKLCLYNIDLNIQKKKKRTSRRQSSQTGPLEVIIETSKLSFSFKVTEYRCSLQSELPYSFALYIETIRIHRRNERPILYIGIFFKKW